MCSQAAICPAGPERSCRNRPPLIAPRTKPGTVTGPGLDTLLKDIFFYMSPVTSPEVASCILSTCDLVQPNSTRKKVSYVSRPAETSWIIADCHRFEMSVAAQNLCGFGASKSIDEKIAFGLDYQVKAFLPVLFHKNCPIRIVLSKRSGDGEPSRKLAYKGTPRELPAH